MKENEMIFVFGSNLIGVHGAGAALYAKRHYNAEQGVGIGRTGNAYAIPTKNEQMITLPLRKIKKYVNNFLEYARQHPELEFQVTRIGCGLAGCSESDIAPMFVNSPVNCRLPEGWSK